MEFFNNIFSGAAKHVTVMHLNFSLPEAINRNFNPDNDIITAQLTCEKILEEQLAKISLEVYESSQEKGELKKNHSLYGLLHNAPNNFQTSTGFFQTVEYNRGKYGNVFALIYRNPIGKVKSL